MLYERSPRNNIVRSPWAIKKLNKRISVKSEYAKRLEEEAEILKKLQHPNIIGYRGENWVTGSETNIIILKISYKYLIPAGFIYWVDYNFDTDFTLNRF